MTHPTIFLLFLVFIAVGTCLQSRFLTTIRDCTYRHTEWWEEFIKYDLEMGPVSDIQKLIERDTHSDMDTHIHTNSKVISYANSFFPNMESRLEIVKFFINVSEKVAAFLSRV
jgi:hypothetical protein